MAFRSVLFPAEAAAERERETERLLTRLSALKAERVYVTRSHSLSRSVFLWLAWNETTFATAFVYSFGHLQLVPPT